MFKAIYQLSPSSPKEELTVVNKGKNTVIATVLGTDIKQNDYSLPTASSTVLGGVKIGDRLTITNGVLSADEQGGEYELPIASSTTLGGIKVGDNLSIDADGKLNAPAPGESYSLPVVTSEKRGGVKIGFTEDTTNKKYPVELLNEQMFVHVPWEKGETYELPLAANGTRGGIQLGYEQNGSNYPVQLDSEKAFVNVPGYTLPVATTSTLGGVIVGDGLDVTTEGVLSVTNSNNKHLVRFIDHHNGGLIDVQAVEDGADAVDPGHQVSHDENGYSFSGWNKAFTNVKSDLIVEALYNTAPKCTVVFKTHKYAETSILSGSENLFYVVIFRTKITRRTYYGRLSL